MSVTYRTVGTWGERASCISHSINKAVLTDNKQKRLRRAEIARAEGLFIKVFKGWPLAHLYSANCSRSIGQSGLFKFKNPGFTRG